MEVPENNRRHGGEPRGDGPELLQESVLRWDCVEGVATEVKLSPNAVVGCLFSDSVVRVVLIDYQVPVGVVGGVKVGDDTTGDAQETHHCKHKACSRVDMTTDTEASKVRVIKFW